MTSERRLFISHASLDGDLAAALKRAVVLGGVPQERVFYSSDRGTGIPAGAGVRQYLHDTLKSAAVVVELVSETFLRRPYCLMELGAAWVLGTPTYPIVVPPLTARDVTEQIGDVQLGVLGDDRAIDELMAELYDGLVAHANIPLRATVWGDAVRRFKAEALAAVAQPVDPPREPGTYGTGSASAAEVVVQSQGMSVRNTSAFDARFATEVHGEITNDTGTTRTVSLKATFYGASGKIIGTATGIVGGLGPEEMKTFTLSSQEPVTGYERYTVQIDNVF